jgi:ABC-type taurine transport system substrate-binding protein
MAARIDNGRAHRQWPRVTHDAGRLDWSDKHPSIVAAFAKVTAKTAYLDGELLWR